MAAEKPKKIAVQTKDGKWRDGSGKFIAPITKPPKKA